MCSAWSSSHGADETEDEKLGKEVSDVVVIVVVAVVDDDDEKRKALHAANEDGRQQKG